MLSTKIFRRYSWIIYVIHQIAAAKDVAPLCSGLARCEASAWLLGAPVGGRRSSRGVTFKRSSANLASRAAWHIHDDGDSDETDKRARDVPTVWPEPVERHAPQQ